MARAEPQGGRRGEVYPQAGSPGLGGEFDQGGHSRAFQVVAAGGQL